MALDTEAGIFLPITDKYDRTLLDSIDVQSDDFKDFLVQLSQRTNNIALVTNIKVSGQHYETEFVNGKLWFEDKTLSITTPNTKTPDLRQVFCKTINFGALPNATTKAVAHGITVDGNLTFTDKSAMATNTSAAVHPAPAGISIPYASATAATSSIELYITKTHVVIDAGAVDRTDFDTCYVHLEFIKE